MHATFEKCRTKCVSCKVFFPSHEKLGRKKQDFDKKKRAIWQIKGRGGKEMKETDEKKRERDRKMETHGKLAERHWKKMRIRRETLQSMGKPVLTEHGNQ